MGQAVCWRGVTGGLAWSIRIPRSAGGARTFGGRERRRLQPTSAVTSQSQIKEPDLGRGGYYYFFFLNFFLFSNKLSLYGLLVCLLYRPDWLGLYLSPVLE